MYIFLLLRVSEKTCGCTKLLGTERSTVVCYSVAFHHCVFLLSRKLSVVLSLMRAPGFDSMPCSSLKSEVARRPGAGHRVKERRRGYSSRCMYRSTPVPSLCGGGAGQGNSRSSSRVAGSPLSGTRPSSCARRGLGPTWCTTQQSASCRRASRGTCCSHAPRAASLGTMRCARCRHSMVAGSLASGSHGDPRLPSRNAVGSAL
mmetsp:Transcript_18803/g.56834  ORF Transcript_18803/g.56834 Transcript_18803/m.56834 type:complete len:203 (-) Transcript_18803:1792-2400(-)